MPVSGFMAAIVAKAPSPGKQERGKRPSPSLSLTPTESLITAVAEAVRRSGNRGSGRNTAQDCATRSQFMNEGG
jgi:hypothetical protein